MNWHRFDPHLVEVCFRLLLIAATIAALAWMAVTL